MSEFPLSEPIKQSIASGIARVVELCVSRAWVTLLAAVIITIAASFYLATNLKINTDNEDMLCDELAFRQNSIEMDRAFPQLDHTILIVLDADNPDLADEKTEILAKELAAQSDMFEEVFSSVSEPFFRQNGLLFLSVAELDDLYVRLAGAQPFIGTLWQQPNMTGLADMTALIAEAADLQDANLSEAARVSMKWQGL